MITIDFSCRGTTGLCDFLISSIKKMIISGKIKSNEKLPSKRALAEHLGVSVITVQNAYAQLICEGYIYSIEKKGFYATELNFLPLNHSGIYSKKKAWPLAAQNREVTVASKKKESQLNTQDSSEDSFLYDTKKLFVDFTSNSTSADKFPFSLWARIMREVLNRKDEKLLSRSSIKGVYELRKAIAKHLNDFRGMHINPEQIIIGAGTESLYSLLVQFLGRSNIYAVENPGYHKVMEVFHLNGTNCIHLKMDSGGISIENLIESNANIVHVSPAHHFPTGIIMPVKRRSELLSWAEGEPNRFIIEDDYDSEFRFNGKPLATLQSSDINSKVIYMNTFSKTLSPSFRISYMVLPENLVSGFEKKLGFYSCQVSSFEQFTLAKFIEEGHYEKHINKMKNYYRGIRNDFINALKKSKLSSISEIEEEDSGLHFILNIKSVFAPEELKKRLLQKGINIALLNDYYYGSVKKNTGEGRAAADSTAFDSSKFERAAIESSEPFHAAFVVNYSALKKEKIERAIELIYEAAVK